MFHRKWRCRKGWPEQDYRLCGFNYESLIPKNWMYFQFSSFCLLGLYSILGCTQKVWTLLSFEWCECDPYCLWPISNRFVVEGGGCHWRGVSLAIDMASIDPATWNSTTYDLLSLSLCLVTHGEHEHAEETQYETF